MFNNDKTDNSGKIFKAGTGLVLALGVSADAAAYVRGGTGQTPLSPAQIKSVYAQQLTDSFVQQKMGVTLSADEQARVTAWVADNLSHGSTDDSRLSRQRFNSNGEVIVATAPFAQSARVKGSDDYVSAAQSIFCVSENSRIKGLFRATTIWDQGVMKTDTSQIFGPRVFGKVVDVTEIIGSLETCPRVLRRIQSNYKPSELRGVPLP